MVKKIFVVVAFFAALVLALFTGGSHILAQSQSKPQLAQTESVDYSYYPDTLGTFDAITEANRQLQSEMNACVQKKQQGYNLLVAQNNQYEQLRTQRDALDNKIANLDSDDKQLPALEGQRDQLQSTMDRLDKTMINTRQALDDGISDCSSTIAELQTQIDDLESELNTEYGELVTYEVPW